jgi:hypothetical protein
MTNGTPPRPASYDNVSTADAIVVFEALSWRSLHIRPWEYDAAVNP